MQIWVSVILCALILLPAVYLFAVIRALRNERVIGIAIAEMNVALSSEPRAQRVLLRAVSEVLVAQENAASRLEVAARELDKKAGRSQQAAEMDGEFRHVLKNLFELPEPQLLITEFLDSFAGDLEDGSALASMARDLVQTATRRTFGGLTGRDAVVLDRLLLMTDGGRISPVAETVLEIGSKPKADIGPGRVSNPVPRLADTDPPALGNVARALDRATRRQLRLATMLHGQAEAIVRVRQHQHGGNLARARARIREMTSWSLPHHPSFQLDDLAEFVTRFDAIGEVVDAAAERLAEGAPVSAIELLAGLRVPVPPGLPGRIYHQDCLAQVRPLAMIGVLHRLALAAWAAPVLRASAGTETSLLPPLPISIPDFSAFGGGADDQLPYPARGPGCPPCRSADSSGSAH